ncbi:MAG: MerR family transcriptional regulator [Fibrobacteraceae bacterium]
MPMKTYRISELGKRFDLTRSTLLYYDRIGVLVPSGRTTSEYRFYTEKDAERLARICFYREAGLGLADIAKLLENTKENGSILEHRLHEITQEIAALKAQQRLIAGMLKTVAAGREASGLDKKLWLNLQKACGLDAMALKSWHMEFERRSPEAHHEFLLNLGLTEKEALQVRMLTKNMEDNKMTMKYFYELFEDLPRQGPGSSEATLNALALIKPLPSKPKVLDIGCGCGAQTLILAQELKTKIRAIDNHRPVLNRLDKVAAEKKLEIETHEMSMMDMPFEKDFFDLLWAEGSLFIIGLTRGLKEFREFLKPRGYLVFSEMCWFVKNPPAEIKTYFDNIYPDIRTEDAVSALAVADGYKVMNTFRLPGSAWWDPYYTPMLKRIQILKQKNAGFAEAQTIYSACETEAEMFRRYSESYGYTFFILQKI